MTGDDYQSAPLARRLRAVGQALEALRVQDFELRVSGGDYLVRGSQATPAAPPPQTSQPARRGALGSLRRILGGVEPIDLEPPTPPRAQESQQLELRFTADDIAKLEQQGQSRRQASPGMPDLHSLPQVLRTIGDYLDRQGHELARVVKQGQNITIEHDMPDSQRSVEERTASSLYDLSVRMYLRRTDRP